ncbi:alpha/beta fold hydrolase [Streptomyces sp. M10(2022)]
MSETDNKTMKFQVDGPEDAPVLVLGPSLGTTWHMWDRQIPELSQHWRIFRYDLPGHGGAPAHAATAVTELADRLLATLDSVGVQRFGYAGCSIGGAIGADLALRHPTRVAALALVAASPRFGSADEFRQRGVIVRSNGLEPIARTSRSAGSPRLRRRPAGHRGMGRPDGSHHRSRLLHRRLRSPGGVRHPYGTRPDRRPDARPGRCRGQGHRAGRGPHPRRGIPDARLALVPGASHLAPSNSQVPSPICS